MTMGKKRRRKRRRKSEPEKQQAAVPPPEEQHRGSADPPFPSSSSSPPHDGGSGSAAEKNCDGHEGDRNDRIGDDGNPLLRSQSAFLSSLPPSVRRNFFSSTAVTPDVRSDVWSRQADLGESLVNRYAWATPDERALRILGHFAPVVEIGCGANAYWARMMRRRGIDVAAYDTAVEEGGRISHEKRERKGGKKKKSKKKRKRDAPAAEEGEGDERRLVVRKGGPEVLSREPVKSSDRALFLCYPDEDDAHTMPPDEDDEPLISMGAACLAHYSGDTVIHVGELHCDAAPTPSLDQAPWGRSSSPEFQQRLAAEYHCVLRASLPGWLHVRDTISVWRRSGRCSMIFAADSDDEDDEDEEVEYRHVPEEERMPTDAAAPCAAHLL